MSRYIITLSASRDLEAISEYFLNRNIETGERLLNEFRKKYHKLVKFPNIGCSYGHIRPELRGLPLDGYVILYRVINNGVEILRVVSCRQDLESLFLDSVND